MTQMEVPNDQDILLAFILDLTSCQRVYHPSSLRMCCQLLMTESDTTALFVLVNQCPYLSSLQGSNELDDVSRFEYLVFLVPGIFIGLISQMAERVSISILSWCLDFYLLRYPI